MKSMATKNKRGMSKLEKLFWGVLLTSWVGYVLWVWVNALIHSLSS